MKKALLLIGGFLAIAVSASGQFQPCGQGHVTQQFAAQHPDFQFLVHQTFDAAQRDFQNGYSSRSSDEVHRVEVVVHIVYNTPEQNISDELVHEQIAILNEDFRRLNPDAGEARDIFRAVGADAGIEFVLADEDPTGQPTNGITRTATEVETFVDLDLDFATLLEAAAECGQDFGCIQEKILVGGLEQSAENGGVMMDDVKRTDRGGADPWDPTRYLNIWVTNLNIDFLGQEMPAILGFAYPPVGAPNWPDEIFAEDLSAVDGVVIHHQAWGKSNGGDGLLGNLADGGRTTTHEVGHYFGLRHVHGDGDCDSDDGISDTPAADANQQAQADPENLPVCTDLHSINTCDGDDLPDMIENYMDYNAITCQNLFTVEQVGIMRAMLEGPRAGLIGRVITSTTETILSNQLRVWPNPTQDVLYLELDGERLEEFDIQIRTIFGQEVAAVQLHGNREIHLGQLPDGVYLVQLTKAGQSITKKVSLLRS